ncbi:MAG: DUF456 family protein [Burkholderiales bacterium]
MELTTLWWLLAILLILVGFAGNILPLLPGTPLMLIGMLLAAWLDDFNRIGAFSIGVLVVLAILSQLAAQQSEAWRARHWGKAEAGLAALDARIAGRDWFVGGDITLADIAPSRA